MRVSAFAFAGLVATVLAAPSPAEPQPLYTLVKQVALGAPDRWDYVVLNPAAERVYVAHGDRVTVVDPATGTVIGNVEGMPGGTHGVAFAEGKGYTDDGRAGTATVFDLETLKPIRTVKAEPDADGIIFDPSSGHIFVIDGDSGKLTVIDPKTDAVVATVDAGGGLEFGVSGENGKLYVDGAEKGEIVRVDTRTNQADAHWPMEGCLKPHGLAIDRDTRRLFASCANKVMAVVNADTGAVVAKLPIGEGTDFAEFDPVRKWAVSSNRDGTLSVISEKSPDTFDVLPAVQTAYGARTMALDPKTGRIYLVTGDFEANPNATDPRRRYTAKPGSAKLLILEPAAQK
ncbi:MAG TPA: YncE family protein [Rhizomicrobium sp.]|nr:YncE family protein [Rhizomicrobium sp.]